MQLFASTAAFLALISSVFAQTEGFDAITSPTEGQILQAGQTYTITWDPTAEYNSDTVTIRLLQGADQNTLDFNPNNVVASISSSLGSYSWTVDSSVVGYATYGLKLQLDKDTSIFQYSYPFKIVGGTTTTSSSTTVSGTTSVSTSSVSKTSTSSSSSATATGTTSTSSTSTSSTSATLVSTTSSSNVSTTTAKASTTAGQTTLTTATKASTTTGSSASATATGVQTAGAGKLAAGTLAAVGCAVVALLAL